MLLPVCLLLQNEFSASNADAGSTDSEAHMAANIAADNIAADKAANIVAERRAADRRRRRICRGRHVFRA